MMWLLSVPGAEPGQNRGHFQQTPLRDCLTMIDVHSQVNQLPSLTFCYAE